MATEIKYRLFWIMGTAISFVLYFSGIVALYSFLRKKSNRLLVRIITYHRIDDDRRNPNITVSKDSFQKQIKFLKKNFSIVPLSEIVNYAKGKNITLSRDTVAITFDDGYEDNFTNAFQILRSYALPACIFLVSGSIGNKGILSQIEIQEMFKNNITFGSHTVNHPILTEIPTQNLENEIKNSREAIGEILNSKVEFFAYPKGKKNNFNEKIKTLIKEAGYLAAFTTENRDIKNDADLFELGRIGIRNCPMFVFKTRMSGIFECGFFSFLRNHLKLT
jgi:peptidoglycan/xylan/chitin deacetylase (PgdA/CDA1 family)